MVMTMTMMIGDAGNGGANDNDYQHIVKTEILSVSPSSSPSS